MAKPITPEPLQQETGSRWPSTTLALVLCILGGFLLGWAAWGSGRTPAVAALLLIFISMCRTRAQAYLLGAGYAFGVLRHTSAFIASWFENNLLVGASAVLAYALVSGAVWCLGWSGSKHIWRKATAPLLAWTVAILPPATVGVPGHPVIAWGSIAPGSQWVGVAASALIPCVWVYFQHRNQSSIAIKARWIAIFLAATLLTYLGQARYQPVSSYGPAAVGITTEWGQTAGAADVIRRIKSIGEMSQQLGESAGPVTVFWPESILGIYDHIVFPIIQDAILRHADRYGQTTVIGIDLPLPGGVYENAAVAFYPDGRSAMAVARQPAPMSLWRPWRGRDTWVADWTAKNTLAMGDGRTAALIFCYEEYLPILYLINEIRDKPDLYVALANTWAERSSEGSDIQTQHSHGMARLFGMPYIKAENRPSSGPDRLPITPYRPQN